KAATIAIADHHGPVYLRFGRPAVPNFTPADAKFEIGKAIMLNAGTDVTIIATGHLVWEALVACEALEKQGISAEVLNLHTSKPLHAEAISNSAANAGCVLTAEEENILACCGESGSTVLVQLPPVPREFVATQDTCGERGTPDELMEKYGLNSQAMVKAVQKVM